MLPLAKFKVLDLTRVRAGPTAVRQFADWGADVIKIEMPPELAEGEGLGGPREGSDFQNLHRNKRGLTLNLKSPEGVAVLKKLAETADVVVENFRPDVKTRLGIDYAALSAVNPRLVYTSISGFGQDGPYAKRPGFDQIAQGMGGLMSITGEPGRGPMRVGIPVADLCAGIFAAMGTMVALLEREQTGRGQWVQTSLLQAQAFMLDFQAARWLMNGEIPKSAGNDHPTSIPTGVFTTSDGAINIATTGGAIWGRFVEAMGHKEWSEDPRFATGGDRSKNRHALNALIDEATRTNTTAYWVETLNAKGVPCGPINNMQQLFEDVQVNHLGIVKQLDGIKYLGQPFVLSANDSPVTRHPPKVGEHSDQILAEAGYSAEQIAEFRKNQVV
ncbi:CoA transferase [Rhodovarius crocodyli]|uniref:CoA transferase n=1 Tax=Rhodovarius crocodyli TaxID=1979269 RepID=A0A437MMH7_9PROT|nr:CaiB/BaiF CoA-transferase family protein [Rhodovarius crocodyli]RVT98833.1 CoA transferase [Rhodovarius crocodyli]